MKNPIRFKIPDDLWNLLSKLADNAKMDWFYDEFFGRKTITRECLDDLSNAFNATNLYNLNYAEVLRLYELFAKHDLVDGFMRDELIQYFVNQATEEDQP